MLSKNISMRDYNIYTINRFKTYIDDLEDDIEFFTKEGFIKAANYCRKEIEQLETDIKEIEENLDGLWETGT